MLEAPTGFGKSAVAYTLAKYVQQEMGRYSHFIVADKYLQEQYLSSLLGPIESEIPELEWLEHMDTKREPTLQEQYIRAFPELVMVKGRNNFDCPFASLSHTTCDKGMCTLIDGFDCPHKPKRMSILTPAGSRPLLDDHGVVYDWSFVDSVGATRCPYWVQKDVGIRSDMTVHNYHYYLYEQNFAKSFARREIGIFDEAHIIENILMGFVERNILLRTLNLIWSERYPDERYKFTIPRLNDIGQWVEWLHSVWGVLLNLHNYYSDLIKTSRNKETGGTKLKRYKDMIERLKSTVEFLSDNPDNWVFIRQDDRVTFKPVTIREFSPMLFNHTNKALLMSATILDHEKLKRYLGIDDEVKFIRVDKSTFPVKNRLVYQDHRGKATAKTMDTYLPKMLDRIDNYHIPKHGTNKGVIHTHTHKIAKYILRNSKHKNIMMSNTENQKSRDKVFQEFFDAEAPCIMVSPSMNLGVDLYDDRCRWQVIVKMPYPYLGDPQIRKRMKLDPGWYDWQTLMKLIQTYGRGCRSTTDWCVTYITDSMFAWLVSKNKKLLPKWFFEAIRRMKEDK